MDMYLMFAVQNNREGKPVSYSAIEDRRIKLVEEYMSPHGLIFGGRILDIVNEFSKQVAQKHTDKNCKIACINNVRFFLPAKRGDILVCQASVNKTWGSSLEVGVRVMAEDFRTLEKKHILSAYFYFDAYDENEKLSAIPYIICESQAQRRRYIESENRKAKTHRYQNISPSNK